MSHEYMNMVICNVIHWFDATCTHIMHINFQTANVYLLNSRLIRFMRELKEEKNIAPTQDRHVGIVCRHIRKREEERHVWLPPAYDRQCVRTNATRLHLVLVHTFYFLLVLTYSSSLRPTYIHSYLTHEQKTKKKYMVGKSVHYCSIITLCMRTDWKTHKL